MPTLNSDRSSSSSRQNGNCSDSGSDGFCRGRSPTCCRWLVVHVLAATVVWMITTSTTRTVFSFTTVLPTRVVLRSLPLSLSSSSLRAAFSSSITQKQQHKIKSERIKRNRKLNAYANANDREDDLTFKQLGKIETDPVQLPLFLEALEEAFQECNKILIEGTREDIVKNLEKNNRLVGLRAVAKDRLKDLKDAVRIRWIPKSIPRVAPPEFGVVETPFRFTRDLDCFAERIDDLFTWFERGNKEKFIAPYFPMIQSSGMGKTKLLYEYRKRHKEEAVMVLCSSEKSKAQNEDLGIFNTTLNVYSDDPGSEGHRESITSQLDDLVKERSGRLILLFDESQGLVSVEGFPFRCVQWWLRRERELQVVAVFAGTTARLSTFYQDFKTNDVAKDATYKYNAGSELYQPFFELCTIGLFRNARTPQGTDDLTRAAKYGRPIFALLANKDELTDESLLAVQNRVLLNETEFDKLSDKACLSLLATLCQMGTMPVDMASTLIAGGYAALTHAFIQEGARVIRITYFPDPVCAYAAMKVMTATIQFSPGYWAKKASNIFSTGLCRPDKGDVGEVAAALYSVLCGNVLRKSIDPQMKSFAVPMKEWMDLLASPENTWSGPFLSVKNKPCVSFIQVCRNYIRHPLKTLVKGPFLREWFEAGLAYYAPPDNAEQVFDIIAPVRYFDNKQEKYCPLLISVKNDRSFSASMVKQELANMMEKLKEWKVTECIYLLVLLGRPKSSKYVIREEDMKKFQGAGITPFVVTVPVDDCFGIWDLAVNTSTAGGDWAEVYASHPVARQTSDFSTTLPLRGGANKATT